MTLLLKRLKPSSTFPDALPEFALKLNANIQIHTDPLCETGHGADT